MYGHQNVHTSHSPPSDPPFRCAGCRVGMALRHVRKTSVGYYYCRTCSVPDRLPDPKPVDRSGLSVEAVPTCARCDSLELYLVEDPYFGPDAEVCRECYAEHGDPTESHQVTTNLAKESPA